MSKLRILWRSLNLTLHILLGLLLTLLVTKRNPDHASLQRSLKMANWWNGRASRILRIHITLSGTQPTAPALIVANHVSWLDIIILGHLIPTVFLSKDEVGDWPIVGWLARRFGTVFIRRGGGQSQAINEIISERLTQGGILTIFPEGTTTDGRQVKPFFSRLFAAAIESNTKVVPVSVRYHVKGEHDHLAPYIDDQSLAQNLLALLKRKGNEVQVHFGTAIEPQGHDRKRLAQNARQAIMDSLNINKGDQG